MAEQTTESGVGCTIWVVVRGYNYEGHAVPDAAFPTKEAADAWIKDNRAKLYFDDIEAVEIPYHAPTATVQESATAAVPLT
jgi:hypothetical protein